MLTDIVEHYLQTGSSRMQHITTSGNICVYLNIVPHSGSHVTPDLGIRNAKFSCLVTSGGIAIAQIDNDHPINVSGNDIVCLHEHVFDSGETIARRPIWIKSIAEAGSYAQKLLDSTLK